MVPLILSLPSQHFDSHVGLATGMVGASAGLFGALFSLITRVMMTTFGRTREPLLIWAGVYASLWALSFWLVEERDERKRWLKQNIRKRKDLKLTREKCINDEGDIEKAEVEWKKVVKAKFDLSGLHRNSTFWILELGLILANM